MRSSRRNLGVVLGLFLAFVAGGLRAQQNPQTDLTNGSGEGMRLVVPRLIKFGGVLRDQSGQPYAGALGLTFAVYRDQQGGAPIWQETQNAVVDTQGNYSVLLGAASNEGLPLDLFASGDARWLGIQPQVAGVPEQPRILLVSVPYALKAADADTLGGRPASAFVLANSAATNNLSVPVDGSKAATLDLPPGNSLHATTKTAGYIPVFLDGAGTVGDSPFYETGGKIGLGTLTPEWPLHIAAATQAIVKLESTTPGATDTSFQLTTPDRNWVIGNNPGGIGVGKFGIFDASGFINRFAIDTAGRVGIGTNSPDWLLHVRTTNQAIVKLESSNSGATDTAFQLVTPDRSWVIGNNPGGVGTGKFSIYDATVLASRLAIDTSGNIGIGTITPGQKLDVVGNVTASGSVTGTSFAGNGATLTNLDAGHVSTGTLTVSRGGTGVTTAQGNGTKVQLSTGTTTTNNCVKFDANGNTADAGSSCGTITAVTAGTGLTGGASSGAANLALTSAARTRGITYLAGCDTCSALTISDDQRQIYVNQVGTMTINSVTCFEDQGSLGSVTINIQRDPDGVSGANVLTSDLQCSITGNTSSGIAPLQQTLNLNDQLHFQLVTTDLTPKRLTVLVKATLN